MLEVTMPEQIEPEQIEPEQIEPEQIEPEQIEPEDTGLGMTRRSLLVLGGATVTLAGTASLTGTRASAATATIPTRATFARSARATLRATNSGRTFQLRLQQILDLTGATTRDDQQSFTIVLSNRSRADLTEGVYRLSGPRLPGTALFLAPTGLRRGNQLIQATINRTR